MSLLRAMNQRLRVDNDTLYWTLDNRPAGDRKGTGRTVSFEGRRYNRVSVIDALVNQDESLLVREERDRMATVRARRAPMLIEDLRYLLGSTNNKEDATALVHVIKLLEETQ